MRGNGGRKWAAGLAAALAVGAAHAQTTPKDLLDRTKQQQQAQIAETRLEEEVAEVLRTAPGLAKSFPDKAVRNLKEMLKKVNVTVISSKKQDELSKLLEAALAEIQGADPKVDPLKARQIRDDKNKKLSDAANAEAKEVNEGITAYVKAVDDRRDADAKKLLAALATKYPNNPSVIILIGQDTNSDAITVARGIADLSARNWVASLNDVQRSAIPAVKDMEFPKNWKEIQDRRKELNAPKLTAEEKKLLTALDTPIKAGLTGAPFQEAVQLLSTAIDQKIYVDTKSLEGQGLNLDDKVDVPGGVTARSALRVMLQSKGLTFVLRDNIIQVVTVEAAKKQCVTRAYDVRDLVSGGGAFNNPLVWGPLLDAQQTSQNAQIIIDAIMKSVDPPSWAVNGGVGSITFHYPTMSLIVRAPSEVQADLYRKMTK